jgi:hypothetical protein
VKDFKSYFNGEIKLGFDTYPIAYMRKNFNTFIIPLLEREGDKKQLDNALEAYYTIKNNTEKLLTIQINGYQAFNLKPILNEDFLIIFAGEHFGTTQINFESKIVPAMIVGSRVHDFKNDFDVFWKENKSYILHELIHLEDYKRIKIRQDSSLDDMKKYYNNPLEFNAFYLEVANYFYDEIRKQKGKMDSITEFIESAWKYVYKIQPELKQNLSKDMLFKWNKRFYQLYDELQKEFLEKDSNDSGSK